MWPNDYQIRHMRHRLTPRRGADLDQKKWYLPSIPSQVDREDVHGSSVLIMGRGSRKDDYLTPLLVIDKRRGWVYNQYLKVETLKYSFPERDMAREAAPQKSSC